MLSFAPQRASEVHETVETGYSSLRYRFETHNGAVHARKVSLVFS
jgi:hypothetical protein